MKYVLVAAIIIFALGWAMPIFAQPQFDQNLTIKYVFDESGNADVTKQVQLTNLDEHVYPSEYVLAIPEDATNISAFDQAGKVAISLKTTDGQKHAVLQLNKKNFGLHNTTEFALLYRTRQLSRKQDTVWNIIIPPLVTHELSSNLTLEVTIPDTWGTPFVVDPPPQHDLVWTQDELGQATITIQVSNGHITPTSPPPEYIPGFSPYAGVGIGLLVVSIASISMYAIQHI